MVRNCTDARTRAARVSPSLASVASAALNSTGWLDAGLVKQVQRVDLWLLCVGMAGVGLQTSFGEMSRAGWVPITAGALQWLVLAALAYGLAVLLVR